jgi:hypothetical protein
MRTIHRRLSKLEARFAPALAVEDGWAGEELLRRIEAMRSHMRPEDIPTGLALEAARERVEAWLRDFKREGATPERARLRSRNGYRQ